MKKYKKNKILSELPFFPKKSKELTIQQLSDVLPFPPKRSKRPKRLTKYQALKNIPFYDSVSISRIQHAFRKEKRGFKYILSVRVTFKRWNNENIIMILIQFFVILLQ